MRIEFIQLTTQENKLIKNIDLTTAFVLSGELKEACSIMNPSITVASHSTFIHGKYNYAHIEAFGRYYFIRDKVIVDNNRMTLVLECDVLQSFRQAIADANGVLMDSTDPRLGHYQQSGLPQLPNDIIEIYANNIRISPATGRYILTCAG